MNTLSDICLEWVWNESALDGAKDYDRLLKICQEATSANPKKSPIPLDTALRCLALVREDLRESRYRVSKECAAWFDTSAFESGAALPSCEHDLALIESRDLPSYCWHYRCRKCGIECGHPDELLEPIEYGPCSCQDSGKCKYVNNGPACMNDPENRETP